MPDERLASVESYAGRNLYRRVKGMERKANQRLNPSQNPEAAWS